MLFLKYDCKLSAEIFNCERELNYEKAIEIDTKSEVACAKYRDAARLCYVKAIKDRCTIIGVFTSDSINNKSCDKILCEFLQETTSSGEIETGTEITRNEFMKLLRLSEHNRFIDDVGRITEIFDLQASDRYRPKWHGLTESICMQTYEKSNALQLASQICCSNTLVPEIRRIFRNNVLHVAGHPVQYIVRTSTNELSDRVVDLLVASLYSNKRIISRRYALVDVTNRVDDEEIENTFSLGYGGTVVIRLNENEGSDEYASTTVRKFDIISKVIKKHYTSVLTIFCCSVSDNRIRDQFCESLPGVTFVEIAEDAISPAKAKEYIKRLAHEKGISSVRGLYAALGYENKSFSVRQLDSIFERWYDKHLRLKVFPQYASLSSPNIVKKKAKGDAYQDLLDMIGLYEQKKMIIKAIDYYKARKMFADYNAFSDRPSMHMAFTGNAGTAKTTVARLFAQIMFDNGLLSSGQFVEVGRADLVGKYVGWTAQIVKEKFKEAKGGVLFIDEAYSLVDDRKGMFGDEAINTIVQEMENMRKDIIVILAGYPDEMREFLSRNSGLSSRIAFHIHFPDYSPDELMQIMDLLAKQKGRVISDPARELLIADFKSVVSDNSFGNGRYVRNVLEKAMMGQASRLIHTGYDQIDETKIAMLEADDFDLKEPENRHAARMIGFR